MICLIHRALSSLVPKMNYFANIPIKFKNQFNRPTDSDDEDENEEDNENEVPISDTEGEDDSGIAEEETQVPHNFPDIQVSDSLDTQTTALNNFFGYW